MKKQKSDHVDSSESKESSGGEDFDLHSSELEELTTEDDEEELSESEDEEDENEGLGDGKIGRSSESDLDQK